ncbi:4'-phosphopantetheinyl transferase superfamily protein [Mycolicibacterium farcinogenes]|uniref:4'-phosphopantetheinyl transferase superfamily protein n=1 Tax=Mycolicibacterium farcinogenes TaxID=1802 RepID=A0ACD1FIL0_MYCFR|nr:4'-phosphopantetheinyl transferase superfamily protein [Mycolicibacterium farcinogenes]QZH66836.1 4'-phosphopantetheinyl transferase superfamily protein [Mycolicibacterium farcinogenes]
MNPPDFALPGHRIRVGCDVVAIKEIENSLASFEDRFLTKIYTAEEVATCAGPNRLPRLAARFAAKEAAIKAFARPDAAFAPLEIEVVTSGHLPMLRLTGSAARLAAEQGWQEVSVSMSHADCHAAAVVVAVCASGSGG